MNAYECTNSPYSLVATTVVRSAVALNSQAEEVKFVVVSTSTSMRTGGATPGRNIGFIGYDSVSGPLERSVREV